ncbi:MAG: sporulation protein YtfJ, partial [Oscillospiraceae bacterium]|nr:sporulation protein YtfJ [Oscillospiraceae bacterium]
MSEHAINGFMGISMEKIRSVVDANTMIGDPIHCGDGTTVIPVSKVSLGFASGGSDLPTRTAKEYFAGGAGAGMSVKPIGFLVIQNGDVRLIQLSMNADKGNVALNMVPE